MFVNDSSYIPMTESTTTTCISKDRKLRVRIIEMTQSQVHTEAKLVPSLMKDVLGFLNAIIPNQKEVATSSSRTEPTRYGTFPEMDTLYQFKGKVAKYLYTLLPGKLD